MPKNWRSGTVVATITALVIWTVLSYALIVSFSGTHVCSILSTAGSDASFHPMTQAEMDAATAAACDRPPIGSILIAVGGYFAIPVIVLTMKTPRARRS